MDPKDEIQKLIQVELENWQDYDKKNEDFRVSQVARFQPLRTLLNKLVASIEPEYINTNILEAHAMVEVKNGDENVSRMSWEIEPNFKVLGEEEEYWSPNLWQKKVNLKEAPGFKVEETRGKSGGRTLEFETEQDVIHCLVQEIAKRVAFYRYEKKRLS
ncbi:MAG: hypothetical protein COW89_10935 [Nitrospinae bacterium CG22_combo_CG10-13_8_21_14_all_47_10]|nr:MAG: hypothetical protein COW89_10935 [Nitrospinae bacterium CG22_combo_CG10-13_8_21_14_all_47_10]